MVWILFLSDTDVSTRALTTMKHLHAFGVYQDLIGGEALASNQSLYLMQTIIMLHLNAFRGVRAISKIGLSLLHTTHPGTFQRLLVRPSIPCYRNFSLVICRSLGFASTTANYTPSSDSLSLRFRALNA